MLPVPASTAYSTNSSVHFVFRGLQLSEFVSGQLRETFYQSHDLQGIKVADPFMGGGTPLMEANRLGCSITGYDINPMAYWIVRQEIEHIDLQAIFLDVSRNQLGRSRNLGHAEHPLGKRLPGRRHLTGQEPDPGGNGRHCVTVGTVAAGSTADVIDVKDHWAQGVIAGVIQAGIYLVTTRRSGDEVV